MVLPSVAQLKIGFSFPITISRKSILRCRHRHQNPPPYEYDYIYVLYNNIIFSNSKKSESSLKVNSQKHLSKKKIRNSILAENLLSSMFYLWSIVVSASGTVLLSQRQRRVFRFFVPVVYVRRCADEEDYVADSFFYFFPLMN